VERVEGQKVSDASRVFHVTFGLDVGGQEKLLVEFARHADRDRVDLHFVSLGDRGALADDIEALGWPVTALGIPGGLKPSLFVRLVALFRRQRPSVVHTHDQRALFYAGPAARLSGVPTVVHTRHGRDVHATPRQTATFRQLSKLVDRFVCVSSEVANLSREQGIAGSRLCTILNGIDLDRFRSGRPDPAGPVVTVARLSPEKDVANLVHATALAAGRAPQLSVAIAGDGACRQDLERLATELGVSDRVTFLGQVSDVPALFARASMFVLPSRSEGIPLTALEAMACGVPVVATRVGGLPEVVDDAVTGLLVPPADPAALAEAMVLLWNDPARGDRMAAAARRRAEERFDIRRMVREYEDLYRSAAVPNGHGGPRPHRGRALARPSQFPSHAESSGGARGLNVAIIASELPYPPTAGNRVRTLSLALRLAKRHRITFIAHRNHEWVEATGFLRDHGIATILVDRAIPVKSGPAFYARLLGNLASPLPYSVASHSSHALGQAARSLAAEERIDLWQFEATALIDALVDQSSASKVVIAHNVESLIWQRYYQNESIPFKRWYIKQQWRKFERFERRAFAAATRLVAVSRDDATLIRDRFGGRNVDIVDNGIDRSYFEAVRPDPDPMAILFLGSLDWRPNLDAIELLVDEIFPRVRAAVPAARLLVVGRKPSPALARKLRTTPGVELHGDVPDVRPFLARSGVMAVPLRIGGGSRLKILEAMAAGLPVISTRLGAEGLELVPGEHYIASDEPAEMADELIACIRDPRPARAIALGSRGFVLDRYDWDALADRLERVWLACLDNGVLTTAGRSSSPGG
jgi:polysaccharide biosynthesis protein PslH